MAGTASEDDLLRIVGEIYEAAGSTERWAACLESIRDLFQATAAHLLHHDHRSHEGGIHAAAVDPEASQLYVEHYHRVDPWAINVKLDAIRVGEAVFGQSLIPHQEMVKTEYYAGVGKPYGLTRGMFTYLETPSATRTSVLSVNRFDRDSEFGADGERLMQILVPHVQRALSLHRRLTNIDGERAAAADVIDRLKIGVLLVGANLKISFVNRSANGLLGQHDGLSIDAGLLRAATPRETTRLNRALASAVSVTQGKGVAIGETALAVSRPSGRRAFQILITPLSRLNEYAGKASAAAALVFISDPEAAPRADAESLCAYFGFTPAEGRFALALAGGQTPQEAADSQRLTRASGRWFTEQLRNKTGSHTQAQAVSVILRSFAIVRRNDD